jgi:hypothetical protein
MAAARSLALALARQGVTQFVQHEIYFFRVAAAFLAAREREAAERLAAAL